MYLLLIEANSYYRSTNDFQRSFNRIEISRKDGRTLIDIK